MKDAYNLGFTGKATLTYGELARVIPVGYLDARIDKFTVVRGDEVKAGRAIGASGAKQLIYEYLDEQNFLGPVEREKLFNQIGTSSNLSFPETSSPDEKVRLNSLANFGNLTIQQLTEARLTRSLSSADYISLENKIFTKNNENLNEFLRFAKAEYSYTEEVAEADDEISVAITAAYDAVAKGLIEFTMDNPDATSTQIKNEGRTLIAEQKEAHEAVKREGYLRYIDNTSSGRAGSSVPYSFPMDPDNPVLSIETFMESDVILTQPQKDTLLGRIKVLKSLRFRAQYPSVPQ